MAIMVEDLDGRQLAAAVVANHAALIAAEAREFGLAAQWPTCTPPTRCPRGW